MKNKIISMICTAVICAAMISTRAFAEEITIDTSIYADSAAELAVFTENSILDDFNIKIKADTITPVYEASIYDYAQTVKLTITPETRNGMQYYLADCVDSNGNFAGNVGFCADGIHMLRPNNDEKFVIDFRTNVDWIIDNMQKANIDTNITEAKFVFVEGFGDVYYLRIGTMEVLVIPKFSNTSYGSCRIIKVDEQFKELANRKLEERNNIVLDPDGNPYTGGNFPVPDSNNNPITGSDTAKQAAALAIGLAALSVSAVGVKAVSKKRKNDR